MPSSLPPLPQEAYDLQREIYGAETTIAPIAPNKCQHQGNLKRVSTTEVECEKCLAGWIDMGTWKINNGNAS